MNQALDLAALWARFITWIGDGTGLPDTILHIHAGMAVLIAARLATGRGLGTFIPFWFVVAAEAANEILDRLHYGDWRWWTPAPTSPTPCSGRWSSRSACDCDRCRRRTGARRRVRGARSPRLRRDN
ncbi:hypothetical protein AB5I41_19370 [Sphingomonas sp. MMS24-JH45]